MELTGDARVGSDKAGSLSPGNRFGKLPSPIWQYGPCHFVCPRPDSYNKNMHSTHRGWFKAFLVLAIATGVAHGCASSRAPEEPPVEVPDAFSAHGDARMPDRWWEAFGDDKLDRLVERALDTNLPLKTAWYRLRAARAVAERAGADLYPDLTLSVSGENRSTGGNETEELDLGLSSEYEVDLWGRIGDLAEAERFRARASLADYRAASVSLSAEVARSWYQLVAARSRLALLRDQVQTNEKVVRLIKARYGTGQIRRADILRQQQLLESTRERVAAAESRVGVLAHRLAVLLGRPPGEAVAPERGSLPELPALPGTGLPVELVRRRPDVRAAHDRLRAADRELAAAVSNQYPRLTLTVSAITSDAGADGLFDQWARSFAGNLVAPLIDAGRRDAEVERAKAVEMQRLYEYGQAVLTAFREVEDALVRETKQREQLRRLRRQLELATDTYQQLRQEYLNGAGNYLEVLTALTDVQTLRRDLITAEQGVIEFRIALYRALAGGFRSTGLSAGEDR